MDLYVWVQITYLLVFWLVKPEGEKCDNMNIFWDNEYDNWCWLYYILLMKYLKWKPYSQNYTSNHCTDYLITTYLFRYCLKYIFFTKEVWTYSSRVLISSFLLYLILKWTFIKKDIVVFDYCKKILMKRIFGCYDLLPYALIIITQITQPLDMRHMWI